MTSRNGLLGAKRGDFENHTERIIQIFYFSARQFTQNLFTGFTKDHGGLGKYKKVAMDF